MPWVLSRTLASGADQRTQRLLKFRDAAAQVALFLEALGLVADDRGDAGDLTPRAVQQRDGEGDGERPSILVQGGHLEQRRAVAGLARAHRLCVAFPVTPAVALRGDEIEGLAEGLGLR